MLTEELTSLSLLPLVLLLMNSSDFCKLPEVFYYYCCYYFFTMTMASGLDVTLLSMVVASLVAAGWKDRVEVDEIIPEENLGLATY